MWESAFNQKLTFNKPTSIFESSILGMGTEPLGSSVISQKDVQLQKQNTVQYTQGKVFPTLF